MTSWSTSVVSLNVLISKVFYHVSIRNIFEIAPRFLGNTIDIDSFSLSRLETRGE